MPRKPVTIEDNEAFADALAKGDFYLAERVTDGFESWTPGHIATNFHLYFSKSRVFQEMQKTPSCQNLPFKTLFGWLQESQNSEYPLAFIQSRDFKSWSSGAAIYLQMMMAAQSQGALTDGWMLLPRLHILKRELSRVFGSSDTWNTKRTSLGFSDCTRD